MRHSLYWDAFELRIDETVNALQSNRIPPVRRVAVFITDACNFKCAYCNKANEPRIMDKEIFENAICKRYGDEAIIHITGGEPSVVSWLYPFIEENANKYRFHLNTNAYIKPPTGVKRLKISFDSSDPDYWNLLVGKKDAFERVAGNIKEVCKQTITSITCMLSRENYKDIPKFIDFCQKEFDGLYAIFFSVYKGTNKRFVFAPEDIEFFFNKVLPIMKDRLDPESLGLIEETLDEKQRLIAGIRFPQNSPDEPCYISISERVFDTAGNEYRCSHLYRDNVMQTTSDKHKKCLYGCNRRLVEFNKIVSSRLKSLI